MAKKKTTKKSPVRKSTAKKSLLKTIRKAPKFSLKSYTAIAVLLVIIGVAYVLFSNAATTGWKMVYQDKFDGTTLNTNDWSVTVNSGVSHDSHHQGIYKSENVSVHDGYLDLHSVRNCLKSGESPTPANARNDGSVCPAGTTTVYSSGKVVSTKQWPSGRIEYDVTLPKTELGLWSALWMRNKKASWGQTNYGELDSLEWYGSHSTLSTSTSIMGAGAAKSHHNLTTSTDLSTAQHTWAMEWSPSGINYYFDSQKVGGTDGASSFGSSISASQFAAIMNDMWEIRMETEISLGNGPDGQPAPDNSKPWYPVDFKINEVRVYTPGTSNPPSPSPSVSVVTPRPSTSVVTPRPSVSLSPSPSPSTVNNNPGVPTGFTATPGDKKVDLKWNNMSGATEYSVRWIRSDSSTKSNGSTWDYAINHGPNPTKGAYTVTGLANGTSYDFQVATKTATAKSNYTSTVVAKPVGQVGDTTKPVGPATLSGSVDIDWLLGGYVVTLSWKPATDNVGVTGYQVLRDGVLSQQLPGDATRFEVTNSANNVLYSYQVKAVDAAGNESYSPVIKIRKDCSWTNFWSGLGYCVKKTS